MMLIASAITTCGLSEYLLPVMGSWLYFATPENRWDDLFHPYIRDFLVPDDARAIKHFYEGLPTGASYSLGMLGCFPCSDGAPSLSPFTSP